YSFGIAFILPAMLSHSLMPFPRIAGAASALTAFLQMALGLLGSAVAALFKDPSLALVLVLPAMGVGAAICWVLWRKQPMPTRGPKELSCSPASPRSSPRAGAWPLRPLRARDVG